MGRKRGKNKPVEAAKVAKLCSGQDNVRLPNCRAAACTLPKSVMGGGNRHVVLFLLHPGHDNGLIT